MSFNINVLGTVPINPDHLHRPENEKNKTPLMKDRPIGFFHRQMIEAYWTVRSFNINLQIIPLDYGDALGTFIGAGGTAGGIAGATAGLAAVEQEQALKPSLLGINTHTQIVHKYSKKIRMGREGVMNNKTQADFGGSKSLDVDLSKDPYIIESRTYKPNEGTIVAPGPLHRAFKNGMLLLIDFSDIVIRGGKYYPLIKINGSAPGYTYSSSLGFGNSGYVDIYFYTGRIPIFINSTYQKATFTGFGQITPGKRCCDRFY